MAASIPSSSIASPAEPADLKPRSSNAGREWRQRARHALPTLGVVAALAGVAAWGHSTGWKLPKFSALIGETEQAVTPWCEDHNVPEASCIECKPDLWSAAPPHGWCKVHGIANCPLEHADLAQSSSPVEPTDAMRERAARALATKPRAENNSRCASHKRRIQFESPDVIDQLGIEVAVVQESPLVEAISANGEVVYDQSRVAHLSSRVAGTAWQVEKQVGDRVAAGELLALVEAADVGRAKSELLRAISESRLKHATVDRLRPLADEQIIPVAKFREAEAELQQSEINLQAAEQVLANYGLPVDVPGFGDADTAEIRRRIQFLGLPDDAVDSISASVTTSNLFPVRSSIEGTVVEREVVAGEVIDTTTQLFTVADDSQMWLILHVRQEDAQYVRPGQSVLFRTTASAEELKGQVRWVSTETDEQTRTVEVRAEIPNADRNLRSNTFGVGRIVLRDEATAIVVPDDAVHWDGCCHVIFVRDKDYFEPNAPKFFHVRKVRLGVKEAGTTEIIAGLLPGEVIATRNSVVLEAQLLKANLGAGCCEACAPKKEK